MKNLVVYYSRKGNTEKIALEKAKELQADFLCIETTENLNGYDGIPNCIKTSFAKEDVIIFPYDTDVASYDKVIICTPLWFSLPAAPIKAFMQKEKHNINCAEYIFVNALGDNGSKAADFCNKTLRLRKCKYTSIQCVMGKIKKEEVYCDE